MSMLLLTRPAQRHDCWRLAELAPLMRTARFHRPGSSLTCGGTYPVRCGRTSLRRRLPQTAS
ncbi:hypothetical protein DSL92_04590 [Billgrantia gudaonensis]|uniref:Uncharacterized protein n=1 Tax=Billgrantia gudaonensis TaxID=376427 RepID=A0A3S0QRV3_9GAMM|nr:hypothetical protein DSL92_04590 [Halomonas gudaonensis]